MNMNALLLKPKNKLIEAFNKSWHKWSIAVRILPAILALVILKFLANIYELEIMELNGLFTTLVAGTIFLIGFLITGILSDYKESEKLPSGIAASIRSLFDDAYTISRVNDSEAAQQLLHHHKTFIKALHDWFYRKERTATLLKRISQMNDYLIEIEKSGVQANYIIKMKAEQNNLRLQILRIDTIRDTEFMGSAYAIVEAMRFAIGFGLVIINIDPFYASLFFTTLVMFFLSYMLLLIKDLDNPFEYSAHGETGTKISLKPIRDLDLALSEYESFGKTRV